MTKNEETNPASMDETNRRELMLIIKDAFADLDNWKAYHSDIANAHQGSPMGIVNNANLHLFRQYRNKVSNDPEVMLAEAGFTNPEEQTKPPVIKLAGMRRESITEARDVECFKDFASDHLKHHNAVPCEYETEGGEVWGARKCYAMAEKLNIIPATGHTPGQWESDWVGTKPHGSAVVWLGENTSERIVVMGSGNDEANARLIAAAPEMLAALKEARDLLASLPADLKELETMGAEDTACKMLEAIAKAEGGAS